MAIKPLPKKIPLKKRSTARIATIHSSAWMDIVVTLRGFTATKRQPYNDKTMRVLREADEGKNLTRYGSLEEMLKDFEDSRVKEEKA